MALPRYRQWCQTTHRHEMLADPQGSWVLYTDVMAVWAATQDANLQQAATIVRLEDELHHLQRNYGRALEQLAHWQAHGVLHEDTSPVD